VPQPLDRELLAWAAGFFDGEGSTIAKGTRARPHYHQLLLSVPQSGSQLPEVLERFQQAALGTGRIDGPNSDGVWWWRPRGRADAESTLALMWPYLGVVKREQANAAVDKVTAQFVSGRVRQRPDRFVPEFSPHPAVNVRATGENLVERAWAAGFFDAEGWFGVVRGAKRKRGPDWLRIRASAPQHSADGNVPEVLLRLQRAVGVGRIEVHGESDDFKWVAEGRASVLRVLELVETWLGSVKLAQAEDAIAKFDGQERLKGSGNTCLRGHTYDRVVTTASGKLRKYCNACARLAERARRAARGGKPRQVRQRADDPSRAYQVKQP
jgi:hypothetical protein